jgi:hypothetical protein
MTDKFVFGVNEFHFIKGVPLDLFSPHLTKSKKKQTEVENENLLAWFCFLNQFICILC